MSPSPFSVKPFIAIWETTRLRYLRQAGLGSCAA